MRMRIASTAGIFFVLLVVALARAFQLCVINGKSFQELANRQHRQRVALPPERGAILDRHRDVLALTVESADIYVRPADAEANGNMVPLLAGTLGLAPGLVAERVRASQPFVWLARNATPAQANAVAALALRGVGSESSRRRFYPRGSLAGQLLGFSGIDLQGLEGIELGYHRS